MDRTARVPARGGTTRIRLFNGTVRRTNDWDGLRRDSQVWFEDGDCLVYFYSQRASQRGASLRIPLAAVHHLQCKYLIDRCVRNGGNSCSAKSSLAPEAGAYTRIRDDSDPETIKYELYIPSPTNLSREQAFRYHLTTRNLFAYAMGGPLVGERLSIALVDLWRRIEEWKVPIQPSQFTSYLEKQGYMDFTENTEHSLACLKLAEEAHMRDLWIDAFVNCVGMHAQLSLSPEFAGISNSTSAMLTRAALEMDLHIGKMIRAVGSFLEEDFSAVNFGLSKAARDHLDYFRSFLYGFYVNKFGYFPPQGAMPWNKRPWASMHRDFQHLYDYLADTKSSRDLNTNGFSNGGICVIQNVQNFDKRHNLAPLQHPLPLLPVTPPKQKASITSHRSFRPLTMGKMSTPADPALVASQALVAATNSVSTDVTRSPLVQEYQRFEKTKLEGKLELAEARKIRWLLVYGVLQMLTSVVKAPPEVRDADTASYPLCVSVRDCPTWDDDGSTLKPSAIASTPSSDAATLVPQALDDLEGRTSRVSIHPDCEADCADDFFASLNISRQDSARSLIAPLSPLKRTSSLRSSMHLSVQALQKSMVGSLTRRSSSVRRSSTVQELKKSRSACHILVEDYDDQLELEKEISSPQEECAVENLGDAESTDAWGQFNFGFGEMEEPATADRPTNDSIQNPCEKAEETLPSPCESNFTNSSDESNDSNRSSYVEDAAESPPTEASSWDGSRRGSEASDASIFVEPKSLGMQHSYLLSQPIIKQPPRSIALNSGTYVPKGIISQTSVTAPSTTVKSVVYVEQPVKAGGKGKEPETTVPRRRSRGLGQLSKYGIVLKESNVW